MTAKERFLALKLLEKQEKNPAYVKQIGIHVSIVKQDLNRNGDKLVSFIQFAERVSRKTFP